jgi:repressor LexA
MQRYFRVTPPSVHQMILTLERQGLVSRVPGKPRSVNIVIPRAEVPRLE